MYSEYLTLKEVKNDIEKGNIFDTSIIELACKVKKIRLADRLIAFKLIHEYFVEELEGKIALFKSIIEKSLNTDLGKGIELATERLVLIKYRLQVIDKLMNLYKNDSVFPYEKNKSYKVLNWDKSHFICTGEGTGNIDSTKAKVIQNSKFENEYISFVIGVKDRYTNTNEKEIPYVVVKLSDGIYKGSHICVRTDKIINECKIYSPLEKFKEDINKNVFNEDHLGDMKYLHNIMCNLSISDRLQGFKFFYEYFEKKFEKELVDTEEKGIGDNSKIALDDCLEFIRRRISLVKYKIQTIDKLIDLYSNDSLLPFKKNKSYEIEKRHRAYFSDTGEGACVSSSKVKIIENSKFENAYYSFVLGIKKLRRNSDNEVPFILVKVSYGLYKGCHIYIDTDNIILN